MWVASLLQRRRTSQLGTDVVCVSSTPNEAFARGFDAFSLYYLDYVEAWTRNMTKEDAREENKRLADMVKAVLNASSEQFETLFHKFNTQINEIKKAHYPDDWCLDVQFLDDVDESEDLVVARVMRRLDAD